MKRVNVSTLKNELSRYLGWVKRGDEVLVLDRNRPIAKLVKAENATEGMGRREYLIHLDEEGIVSLGKGSLSKEFFRNRPKPKKSVVDALLRDREEGW